MKNHRQAFLQAIIENPEDDTPRLVFADWLEENGDDLDRAKAELIRTQCRLAKGGLSPDEARRLQRRERSLLAGHLPKPSQQLQQQLLARPLDLSPLCGHAFRRGFVESAAVEGCNLRDLGDIFARAPIRNLHVEMFGKVLVPDQVPDIFLSVLGRCSFLSRLSCLSLAMDHLAEDPARMLAANPYLDDLQILAIRANSMERTAGRTLRGRFEGRYKRTPLR